MFKDKTLSIKGTSKFETVIPIEKGIGAVAIKYKEHKTCHIVWYVINEDGEVLKSFSNFKATNLFIQDYKKQQIENCL